MRPLTSENVVEMSPLGELPSILRDLLQDTKIKKVGVGIKGMSPSAYPVHAPFSPTLEDDIAKLRRDWGIEVRGVLDLSDVAWDLDAAHWHATRASTQRQPIGLAKLVERYLEVKLIKPQRAQRSNWENPLNESQMSCGFTIAFSSLSLGTDCR